MLSVNTATYAEETILGFDFGEKRIGVAVGNTVTSHAEALTTLHVESNAARLDAVEKLVVAWQPAGFVIGQPEHADGRPHDIAHLAKKFGQRLTEKFRLPVAYVNETLSSHEAGTMLAARGIKLHGDFFHPDNFAESLALQPRRCQLSARDP